MRRVARWTRKVLRRVPDPEVTRRRDLRRGTFVIGPAGPGVRSLLHGRPVGGAPASSAARQHQPEDLLAHRFDLLGSGPVLVRHGITCQGLEGISFPPSPAVEADRDGAWLEGRVNASNLRESRRIWRLVDPGYVPIDWQLDFKSGFRWSEGTWYRDIRYARVRGSDVKVPWELARLHHLPQLALGAVAAAAASDEARARRLAREIRNQALDFIATNPPRFGVNWTMTMDVAIRAVNLLVARDILVRGGLPIDRDADAIVRRSLLEHGRHVAGHLEWDPVLRGNHYLSDLVGLVFLGTALGNRPEAREWLAVAEPELLAELELQFNADGTSFEGSTSYHRLATELAIHGVAVLLGAGSRLPDGLGSRLAAMADFTEWVTRPDGRAAQLGDNDSGRLFKLDDTAAISLDHRHVRGALGGIARADGSRTPDGNLAAAFARGRVLPGNPPARDLRVGSAAAVRDALDRIAALPEPSKATYAIPLREGLAATDPALAATDPALAAFPDGGFWVVAWPRRHLVIRCGPVGQRRHGGHDHLDQLSFDLWDDGSEVIEDPGTYLYTPIPELRNRYRSAAAHSGPLMAEADAAADADADASAFDRGLFTLVANDATCLAWGEFGFAGSMTDRSGRTAIAVLRWFPDRLEVSHGIENGELDPRRRTADWKALRPGLPVSRGYGLRADHIGVDR